MSISQTTFRYCRVCFYAFTLFLDNLCRNSCITNLTDISACNTNLPRGAQRKIGEKHKGIVANKGLKFKIHDNYWLFWNTSLACFVKSICIPQSLLGSRDGTVVRALASHQCGPGSIPGLGVICGLSLVGSRPCSERFFSGYSGVPLSSKTNTSKFQFDL